MKKILLLMIGLTCLFNVANTQTFIPLYTGEVPFTKAGADLTEMADTTRIMKVTKPGLYHFKSKASAGSHAAVIIVPGGGYGGQAVDHEGWMPARWFTERGIEAFVLKYRLPDETLFDNAQLVPMMDAQQAIALVRARAAEYGIDPQKIGIIGFSAGGHLAASASTLFSHPANNTHQPQEIRPDFSILVYPVITMDTLFTHMGSRNNLIGINPQEKWVGFFSLENQVSEQTPVTFMIHALDDKAVPVQNSDRYAQNLFEKGGDVTKLIIPAGAHGFGFRQNTPVSWWTQYLETWLKIKQLSN